MLSTELWAVQLPSLDNTCGCSILLLSLVGSNIATYSIANGVVITASLNEPKRSGGRAKEASRIMKMRK